MDDVEEKPHLYTPCDESYFRSVWRNNYANVRLRKYCKFAKCEFCVDWRRIYDTEPGRRAEASQRLKIHRQWANVRERAVWKKKITRAHEEPLNYISVSIDGTDKFPNGFPHFWEKSKGDCAHEKRLKLHIDIACVHGNNSPPYIYLADESIRSDPNLTGVCVWCV
jgi:hypothetical protein